MNRKEWVLVAALSVVLPAASHAAPVYTEDFNLPGFEGTSLNLTGIDLTSDNWGATDYFNIVANNGWSFATGAYLATKTDAVPRDGALLLNENGGAAGPLATTNITGLTVGQLYDLTFTYWGDNRPGQDYVLRLYFGSGIVDTISGTDGTSGSIPGGTLHTYSFTATANSLVLGFGQNSPSGSQASPIVDNLSITAVPVPAAVWLLGSALLGMMGMMRRRS
jgi:hypothetical protein